MKYTRVYIDTIGYELPPVIVTSAELEARLGPLYETLRIPMGQLEALTGIAERRWWEPDYPVSRGAAAAARKALAASGVTPKDVGVVIYAGVCREQLEPATACHVAADLGVGADAAVFDISNACLGVLNGIIDIANRIELGQVRAGLVVSCETAREITNTTIEDMLRERNMDKFRSSLATLTGGSGAVAVLVTDGSFTREERRRLLGGMTQSAPQHHRLCRWGWTKVSALSEGVLQAARHLLANAPVHPADAPALLRKGADLGEGVLQAARQMLPADANGLLRYGVDLGGGVLTAAREFMFTDSVSVLRYGVELGLKTWKSFLTRLGWGSDTVDKVICHQVGSAHREAILKTLGIPHDKEYSTYSFLGNMGTVSLPLTAALAEEREFLRPGDRVGLLGIGSGLNCMMLGVEW
jgi:3-oxoacyl-[acyl-carrier-protein] synthase III